MPFADAMTVGREARHTGARSLASRLATRPTESPAAAAAPVPRKPRRDTEDIGGPMRVTPESASRATERLPAIGGQESGIREGKARQPRCRAHLMRAARAKRGGPFPSLSPDSCLLTPSTLFPRPRRPPRD